MRHLKKGVHKKLYYRKEKKNPATEIPHLVAGLQKSPTAKM